MRPEPALHLTWRVLIKPMAVFQGRSGLQGGRGGVPGLGTVTDTGDVRSAAELRTLPATPTALAVNELTCQHKGCKVTWCPLARTGRPWTAGPQPGQLCKPPVAPYFPMFGYFELCLRLVWGLFLSKIKPDLLFLLRIINKKLKH